MLVIAIEELEPEMMLAEAVRNHQGQLLLEAGRKVTERTIRVFKSWGIRRVAIQAGSAGADNPFVAGDGASAAVDEALLARFADVLHDPIMVAIMQAIGRQIASRRAGKKSRDGRS
jgi:hypothetical protein